MPFMTEGAEAAIQAAQKGDGKVTQRALQQRNTTLCLFIICTWESRLILCHFHFSRDQPRCFSSLASTD
jgi:hypothetical protein